MGSCTGCGAPMADDDDTCVACGTSRRTPEPAVRGEAVTAGTARRPFDQFATDDAAEPGAPVADPPVGVRRRLVYALAVIAALSAITAGAVWARAVWGTERTGTSETSPPDSGADGLDPPADAVALTTSGGSLAAVPSSRVTVPDATCTGLLQTVLADECVELSGPGRRHALTLSRDVGGVRVEAFELVDDDDGAAAIAQLSGLVAAADVPSGAALVVHAATAVTSSGSAFVVASTVDGGGDRPPHGYVEFAAPDRGGTLRPAGVIAEGPAEVAVDDGRLLVASERYGDDPCCITGVLVTTVYPRPDGWVGGAELLDEATAAGRMGAADPVTPGATVRVDASAADVAATTTATPTTASTAVTTTVPPTLATTPPPATAPPPSPVTTSTAPPADVPFATLECDNSWIAVVASRPASQVADALAANPGARVVKNDESCASLTPQFTSGAYTGQVIHVVFYGPFADRASAQNECIARGKPSADDCYAAVLSPDPADRTTRFGPGS